MGLMVCLREVTLLSTDRTKRREEKEEGERRKGDY